jgi:hypothetical protein
MRAKYQILPSCKEEIRPALILLGETIRRVSERWAASLVLRGLTYAGLQVIAVRFASVPGW